MATPRNRKQADEGSSLVKALEFVSLAQKKIGTPNQTHCMLAGNQAIAFDGTLALGTPIEEDVSICPHTGLFLAALQECGQSFILTQLDDNRLAVKAGPFEAFVPCMPREALPSAFPDRPVAPLNETLRTALAAVSGLVSENAQHVVSAAILLRRGSAFATDRFVMVEYWHGLDLPTIVIPKVAAVALAAIDKPLASFGFHDQGTSATFHFADGSWLRTQLYIEGYPHIDSILQPEGVRFNAWPVPPNFFKAVKAVAKHNDAGLVVFGDGELRSHESLNAGASYKVTGTPKAIQFRAKDLLEVEPYAKTIDFVGAKQIAYFFGDNVRGCILQRAKSHEQRMREWKEAGGEDDEIPF